MSEKWFVSESELDDYQYDIRRLNPDFDYLIQGCAGSGKTVLALWRAKEIQSSKRGTYYVIVFTKALRTFIKDGIRSLGLDAGRVLYFEEWLRLGQPSADYIIIDEVQDFKEGDIKLFKEKANKSVFFLGDDAQQLYEDREDLPNILRVIGIPGNRFKNLAFNYRLPKKVARVAEYIMEPKDELVSRCKKEGTHVPQVRKFSSMEEEIEYIAKVIKNERLTDVGILLPKNSQVKLVFQMMKDIGIHAECKYYYHNNTKSEINTLDFSSEAPKIMTYHSSKGLQFEDVFLPFCEENGGFFRNPLYVAITRASERVVITYSGNLTRFFKDVPSIYYEHIHEDGFILEGDDFDSPF